MALSEDPGLQAARAASRAQVDEATRSLRQLAARLSAERDTFRSESARRLAEVARQARSGELGPDRERLQRRIDAGETTMDDVVHGRDDDPSAVVARARLDATLTVLREEVEDDEEFAELDRQARATQERASGGE